MTIAQTLTDNWQTTKSDFLQVRMTVWSWFLAARKGSKSSVPGSSCNDILISGEALGDGEYWIDPTDSENAFPAFCDMTSVQGTLNKYFLIFKLRDCETGANLRWHKNYYQWHVSKRKSQTILTQLLGPHHHYRFPCKLQLKPLWYSHQTIHCIH